MAHSGPSQACASFAPTMSVRLFGHFEQFSTFSARRAPCSAPSCTPDAWTNGPYTAWVLWIVVTMVRTPRGRSGASFVKVLSQSECGNFAILAIVDPIWIVTTPSGMGIFRSQVHGSLCWTPGRSRMECRIRSLSRRGDILLRAPPILAHFEQPKRPPFGTPISPPRVVNWWPHISMPTRSPDLISSCALRYRSGLLSCEPLALPWPGEPRVGMTPFFVILAS